MPKALNRYKDEDKELLYRNRQRKENYKQTRVDTHRRAWSPEEIKTLTNYTGTDRELSKKLNRSVQAIQVIRCKLKIPNEK